MHTLNKMVRYIRICSIIMFVSMFGTYKNSGWNGDFSYALYIYNGDPYFLPTFEKG